MGANAYPVEQASLPEQTIEPASPLAALLEGARRALRHWPVLLLMLLGSLLAAAPLALVPALNLAELAHRPAIARMAAGIPAWQILDLLGLMPRAGYGNPASNGLAFLIAGFVFMPLVGGVVSAFLYGGVMLTLNEDAPRFRLGRFLGGCWRWFGANLALGLLQALLFVIAFAALGLALFLLWQMGPLGIALAILLGLLALVLWVALFELTRARLVLDDTRNPFRAFGQAARILARRPLALLVFYAAGLLALLLVQLVFRLGINPRVPLDALLVAVLVQQGFILLRLFCQAARLAGLLAGKF